MNQLSTKRMKPNESPIELLDRHCISGWGDSETEASEILSDGAASSGASTAEEVEVESSHGEPEDYEMVSIVDGSDGGDWWIEGPEGPGRFFMRRVESSRDEPENSEMGGSDGEPSDDWWAAGPDGWFMRLEYRIVIQLDGCSSSELMPLNRGWVLDEGPLLELALELEC